MNKRLLLSILLLILAALACSRNTAPPAYTVTATLPADVQTAPITALPPTATLTVAATATPLPTATPDLGPTYVVQADDSLLYIALLYNTSIVELVALNGLSGEFDIYTGQVLMVPGEPAAYGPTDRIIPDSEFVYGPAQRDFDTAGFVALMPGYLASYIEDVDGETLTGAAIVQRVAQNYSVSPRLLLAMLEYQGGWLLNPTPDELHIAYPMEYVDAGYVGLDNQLRWATNKLCAGYYGRRNRGLSAIAFPDGTRAAIPPALNAGTVAVQYFLAQLYDVNTWTPQVQQAGFFTTYMALFGDPFTYAVEPLVPAVLIQPELALPWAEDETWYYTGGPHGAWASGSAWGAIDFAPPGEMMGCYVSESPTRAVAPGLVVSSEVEGLWLDLDGDGYEGTGWNIFYMHLTNRVPAGTQVNAGDVLGYASCEGGFSTATHVHIARKYNGEWVPAQCPNCAPGYAAPVFVLGGWTVGEFLGQEYDGYMTRGEEYREAFDGGREDISAIVW